MLKGSAVPPRRSLLYLDALSFLLHFLYAEQSVPCSIQGVRGVGLNHANVPKNMESRIYRKMHRKRMRICSISTKDFPRSLPSNHKGEPPFIQSFCYLDVLCSRDRLVGTCLEKYGLFRMNVRSVADRDNGPHLIQMPRSVRRDHPDKDVLNQSPVSQCISDRTRRGQQTSNFQEITTSRESLAKGAGSFCQSGFLELTNG